MKNDRSYSFVKTIYNLIFFKVEYSTNIWKEKRSTFELDNQSIYHHNLANIMKK